MTGTDLCVNRPQSVPVIFEPRCNLGGGGWYAVAQLVKALRYKPEGHGFDSRWCYSYNPSGRTMALSRISLQEKRVPGLFPGR